MAIPKGYREKKTGFPKTKCTPDSIRTKIVSKTKRVLICCPRGSWSAKTKRCKSGTRAFRLLVKNS